MESSNSRGQRWQERRLGLLGGQAISSGGGATGGWMESSNSKGQQQQRGDSTGEGGLNLNNVVLMPDASKRRHFDGFKKEEDFNLFGSRRIV